MAHPGPIEVGTSRLKKLGVGFGVIVVGVVFFGHRGSSEPVHQTARLQYEAAMSHNAASRVSDYQPRDCSRAGKSVLYLAAVQDLPHDRQTANSSALTIEQQQICDLFQMAASKAVSKYISYTRPDAVTVPGQETAVGTAERGYDFRAWYQPPNSVSSQVGHGTTTVSFSSPSTAFGQPRMNLLQEVEMLAVTDPSNPESSPHKTIDISYDSQRDLYSMHASDGISHSFAEVDLFEDDNRASVSASMIQTATDNLDAIKQQLIAGIG